jgi:DNA-directed RNA polymerase specialized sigma24 family protein
MSSADPVSVWIAQVKEGQHTAVQRLLERYFRRLVQLAHARLRARPELAAYDEDVALSAFKSLCLGAEQKRFPRLLDRDDLWRLLALLTVRKAIDLQRRRRPEGTAAMQDVEQLLSREPAPEPEAAMAEEHRRLLDRLGDPQLQAIALWKVEGCTNEEIADRLGVRLRSGYRHRRVEVAG